MLEKNSVEYGQKWCQKFTNFLNFLKEKDRNIPLNDILPQNCKDFPPKAQLPGNDEIPKFHIFVLCMVYYIP